MRRKRKQLTNKLDISNLGQPLCDFPFPKRLIGGGKYLRPASGDSMTPTITPGDFLLIEPGHDWNDNDIVIAKIGDQETCKRLQIEGDKRFLVPDNPSYAVIQIGREVKFTGRVIGKYQSFLDNPNDTDD